ncbi:MAG: hypothetical protein ACSHXD_15875 [Marinosulfonomonas sp.]
MQNAIREIVGTFRFSVDYFFSKGAKTLISLLLVPIAVKKAIFGVEGFEYQIS